MLFKRCARCGKPIPQTSMYCEKCSEAAQSRHVDYNRFRRNKRSTEFYVSPEWRYLRGIIMRAFDGIDIYAYYIDHEVVTADCVHHIVEISDDWNRRLDPTNLIPLSDHNHGIISSFYSKSEEIKRQTQVMLYSLVRQHFAASGGILRALGFDYK